MPAWTNHTNSLCIQQRAEGETPKPPLLGYIKARCTFQAPLLTRDRCGVRPLPPLRPLQSPDCQGQPACQTRLTKTMLADKAVQAKELAKVTQKCGQRTKCKHRDAPKTTKSIKGAYASLSSQLSKHPSPWERGEEDHQRNLTEEYQQGEGRLA